MPETQAVTYSTVCMLTKYLLQSACDVTSSSSLSRVPSCAQVMPMPVGGSSLVSCFGMVCWYGMRWGATPGVPACTDSS
jgi:hypothetical protein